MQNKQAGGIVSFIIVLVALAGLLAGGLYLSKQQGRTARDNDTSTPQVATNQNEDERQDQQQGAQNRDNGTEQETPAPAAPQQNTQTPPTNQQNQRQNQPQTSPSTTSPGADRVANTGPSDTLPSTGPSETVAVTLGLFALVFTGYRLAQSRRALRRSALRQ
jgi:FtsZ-interacting cell division protein ZipA